MSSFSAISLIWQLRCSARTPVPNWLCPKIARSKPRKLLLPFPPVSSLTVERTSSRMLMRSGLSAQIPATLGCWRLLWTQVSRPSWWLPNLSVWVVSEKSWTLLSWPLTASLLTLGHLLHCSDQFSTTIPLRFSARCSLHRWICIWGNSCQRRRPRRRLRSILLEAFLLPPKLRVRNWGVELLNWIV